MPRHAGLKNCNVTDAPAFTGTHPKSKLGPLPSLD